MQYTHSIKDSVNPAFFKNVFIYSCLLTRSVEHGGAGTAINNANLVLNLNKRPVTGKKHNKVQGLDGNLLSLHPMSFAATPKSFDQLAAVFSRGARHEANWSNTESFIKMYCLFSATTPYTFFFSTSLLTDRFSAGPGSTPWNLNLAIAGSLCIMILASLPSPLLI